MDFIIAIPSFQRSTVLLNRTYKYLKKYGIEDSEINIFVVAEEYDIYKTIYPTLKVVIGERGIDKQRDFISKYYKEGQFIVSLDDDITNIWKYSETTDDMEEANPIDLILDAYEQLQTTKYQVVGIYPTSKGVYTGNRGITYDLKNIVGGCRLFLNNKRLERRTYTVCEDCEITMKYYLKYGGVIRLNNYLLNCNYNTLQGGINSAHNRTPNNKWSQVHKFIAEYPDYAVLRVVNHYPELILHNINNIKPRINAKYPKKKKSLKKSV